jgi:hypothetical protein
MNPKIFYIYRNCLKENYSPPERRRRDRELIRKEFLKAGRDGSCNDLLKSTLFGVSHPHYLFN